MRRSPWPAAPASNKVPHDLAQAERPLVHADAFFHMWVFHVFFPINEDFCPLKKILVRVGVGPTRWKRGIEHVHNHGQLSGFQPPQPAGPTNQHYHYPYQYCNVYIYALMHMYTLIHLRMCNHVYACAYLHLHKLNMAEHLPN